MELSQEPGMAFGGHSSYTQQGELSFPLGSCKQHFQICKSGGWAENCQGEPPISNISSCLLCFPENKTGN